MIGILGAKLALYGPTTASKFQTSSAKSSANVTGNGTYAQGACTVSFTHGQLADMSDLEAVTLNAAGGWDHTGGGTDGRR